MRPKLVRISVALFCLTAVLGVERFSVKAADTDMHIGGLKRGPGGSGGCDPGLAE
jgi:hypothetical protein